MAVKVMVAPVIDKGDLARAPSRKPAKAKAQPRPKRRRSAVYDADGNEVFITLICLKCQKIRPLSLFGLRRMADGAIRNQPWCRSCRSGPSEKAEKAARSPRPEAAIPVESPIPGESPAVASPVVPSPASAARRPRSVAAEVAAALAGGRG
jgi:hypothetical protein